MNGVRQMQKMMMTTTTNTSSTITIIDGSYGEGGGQLLRNAISLAAILNKRIQITNIRAGRSKPGLKAQHMTGLRLCADIRQGRLEGCELHSTQVTYTPPSSLDHNNNKKNQKNHDNDDNILPETKSVFVGDTKTAGSICLVLQASLPVLLFARQNPAEVILKGGTNASMAPQYDYWEQVFLPILMTQCHLPDDLIEPSVIRRGYFPMGKGEVHVDVEPWLDKPLTPIVMTDRGSVTEIRIRSYYAGSIPVRVANEMVAAAKKVLRQEASTIVDLDPDVEIVHETEAVGNGCGIMIVATTSTGCLLAGSALGEIKKHATQVGKEAAEELVATLQDGGCVDEWLQDQLILFMALANGTSEILTGSLTQHTHTAMWLAEQLSGASFHVTRIQESTGTVPTILHHKNDTEEIYGKDGRIAGKHLIRCTGIGHVNHPARTRG